MAEPRHMSELSDKEAQYTAVAVSELFNSFIRAAATGLNLCPNCTYALVKSYIDFLEKEAESNPTTEH